MLTEGSVYIQTCLHHSDDSSADTVELGRYCRSWSAWWTVMKWMTEYIPAQGCASTHRNTPSSQSQKVEWRNSSKAFCSSKLTESYNLIGLNQSEVYKVLARSVFSTSCMLHTALQLFNHLHSEFCCGVLDGFWHTVSSQHFKTSLNIFSTLSLLFSHVHAVEGK